MKERSLVAFTLLGQAAAGMAVALGAVRWVIGRGADGWLLGPILVAGVLLVLAAVAAVPHLGSPGNAWRTLAGVGSSWLSREIAFGALLGLAWAVLAILYAGGIGGPVRPVVFWAAAAAGVGLVLAMARVYRLRTVPPWDTPLTDVSFLLTAAALGGVAAALALAVAAVGGASSGGGGGGVGAVQGLALVAAVALGAQLLLAPQLRRHRLLARARVDAGLWGGVDARGALLRPVLLLVGAGACVVAAATVADGPGRQPVALLVVAAAAAVATAVLERTAFYAGYARRGV